MLNQLNKSLLRCSLGSYSPVKCSSFKSFYFSTKILKYPGYNQVILSKGKSKEQSVKTFNEIAQGFCQLMIENTQIPRFDVWKDLKDPTSFVFLEVYNGPGAFQRHVESQEFDQFQVVAEPLLEDEFELEEFQTIYPMQVSYSLRDF